MIVKLQYIANKNDTNITTTTTNNNTTSPPLPTTTMALVVATLIKLDTILYLLLGSESSRRLGHVSQLQGKVVVRQSCPANLQQLTNCSTPLRCQVVAPVIARTLRRTEEWKGPEPVITSTFSLRQDNWFLILQGPVHSTRTK